MTDKRKLQCDIDRTLKRIIEGRNSFQDILDKFESSTNQVQKEKFECDLKKEIKRLQRFRDQIKTWLTCNEIKDKNPLTDARKLIELDMERFKLIEKETKTKAYSKEGLLSTDVKRDPLQKEKEDLGEWLKQSISSLQGKSEKYEYDLETLSHTSKRKRSDKNKIALVDEKKQKLNLCAFHIEKLETVMRHFDNERLDCSKVRSLKDPLEYLIESIDDAVVEDYRSLYDDMHLDELSDEIIMAPNAVGTVSIAKSELNASIMASTTEIVLEDDEKAPILACPLLAGSPTSSPSSSVERVKHLVEEISKTTPSNLSTTNTLIKELKEKLDKPDSVQFDQLSSASLHFPLANKKSSIAVKQHTESAIPDPEKSVHIPFNMAQNKRENYAKLASESKKKMEEHNSNSALTVNTPTSLYPPPLLSSITDVVATSKIPSLNTGMVIPTYKCDSTVFNFASTAPTSNRPSFTTDPVVSAGAAQQQGKQSLSTPLYVIQPRDALAPFRNQNIDKQRPVPAELRSQMQLLDCAFRRLPFASDTEKARMLVHKKPTTVPSYFPSESPVGIDSEEYFAKLDAQTLFFLFYYFEGTKAQYLAAKALKRMSWRFHTKYMTWFQRNEEPREITEEFESGTYIYYDFQTMTQRKKEEFIFFYNFLEDKDL